MIPIKNEMPPIPKYFIGLQSGKKYYVTGIGEQHCRGDVYCKYRMNCITNNIIYMGYKEDDGERAVRSICERRMMVKRGE